jgi:hypothetical protein
MNNTIARISFAALVALAAVACAPAGGTLTPSPSAGDSPNPTATPAPTTQTSPSPEAGRVTSAAQAAALVFEANLSQFAGIGPLQRDLIGQSAWYDAFETGDGYSVVVTMGSGDCMAGCINRRTWTYGVAHDGTIELVSEEGDDIEISIDSGTSDAATIQVHLSAGPICPVEQNPPDPNCAPRAIANAEVVLRAPSGAEVARGTSGADGRVAFSVPGGAYYVEAMPVEGMMGQAEAQAFAVVGGSSIGLALGYDTGIR